MSLIEEAAKRSRNNRISILNKELNSCYSCLSYIHTEEIKEWTDKEQTPICPSCGVDAILPGYYAKPLLRKINKHWF
jgi:hypothetical protein